jgi:hypothetical protein
MKITINIDCTPEEARRFFGLPDLGPLQESALRELEKRIRENIAAMDAEGLMKAWLPTGMEGWERLQEAFWTQMGASARPQTKAKPKNRK